MISAPISARAVRHTHVRREGAPGVAGREGQDATAALITALADEDPDVRRAAARGLASREGQDVTAALLTALADRDNYVRWRAAAAIEQRHSPQDLLIVTKQTSSLAPSCFAALLHPALGLTSPPLSGI